MSGRPTPPQPIEPQHPLDLGFRRQLPSELGKDTRCHEDRHHRGEPEAVHTATLGRGTRRGIRCFPTF